MLRTVSALRYVTPFREGGSLPGLVEADDEGLYVVKFRGAGQGTKVLIAEFIAGELARALGLNVPELVLIELDATLGRAEPDYEIRELLQKSVGLNLALDYLPRSVTFDPVAGPAPRAEEASRIVAFDAFVLNMDRTPKNPNLLSWHKKLWLIDHGASLYFHHGWEVSDPLSGTKSAFPQIRDHVLLPWATALGDAGRHLQSSITDERIAAIVSALPAEWLETTRGDFPSGESLRAAYGEWLRKRLNALPTFLEGADRARANLV